MAKTSKKAKTTSAVAPHPRSHEAISEMLQSITPEESLRICKEAGIITADGKLSSTYKSWGKGPTMTPTYEQLMGEK